MTWPVERVRSTVRAFHERALPEVVERAVWVADPTGPALVLGSAQPDGDADRDACEAAGIDVVRRRSGGGAVLVVPGDLLWVDVLVPRGDPLWADDVGRAFLWLGDAWAGALADLGVAADVHRGGLVASAWSRKVCFAGRGTGEVLVGEAKVVGLAQRRTRAGARFQCAALLRWDPATLVDLLTLSDQPAALRDLGRVAAGVRADPEALLTAFLDRLPA